MAPKNKKPHKKAVPTKSKTIICLGLAVLFVLLVFLFLKKENIIRPAQIRAKNSGYIISVQASIPVKTYKLKGGGN